MKRFIIFFLLLLMIASSLYNPSTAQTVKGQVVEYQDKHGDEKGVPFVNVFWLNTTIGAVTAENGNFELPHAPSYPASLVFSHITFQNDTILVESAPRQALKVVLKESNILGQVEKVVTRESDRISTLDPMGTQLLTSAELKKAACCNLSESFETNASVDVVHADAVSGAKTIQMLGLDGLYAQIMFENMPLVRGMASAYGMSFIPGTWIESIQVTKGTGSVLNGFESITGQINLEYMKPEESDKWFFNAFANHNGRMEGNMHYAYKMNDNWSTMTFVHGSQMQSKIDHNKDGFRDMPTSGQLNLFNRWKYRSDKRATQFGVQFMDWNTTGGQVGFVKDESPDTTDGYGIGLDIRQYGGYVKNGFLFPQDPYKSIGMVASVRRTEQDSHFGLKRYQGSHNNAYANLIYQSLMNNIDNTFKTGLSFLYDGFDESFNDSSFTSHTAIPGAFFEYTYNDSVLFSLIAGIRADYYIDAGLQFSPRVHVKYNPADRTALRASVGRGFRTPRVYAENGKIFASARQIMVREDLDIERAWNYGVSFQQKFDLFSRSASLNGDYYHTLFQNQIVVDMDSDAGKLSFYNLDGKSYSHSMQADLAFEPVDRLKIKTAGKYYLVRSTYNGQMKSVPLVPKQRALLNVAYKTFDEKWIFDATLNWYGSSRIPKTLADTIGLERQYHSPAYHVLHVQVTKEFKLFESYVGVENALGFTQENPITDAGNPFSPYFDGSLIWGPLNKQVVYIGLRLTII